MDVLDAIRMRRSVRSYSPKAIPPEVMARMRQAVRSAPSACNYQPRRLVLVTAPELRRKLAEAAKGQSWIADAPVIVVACGIVAEAYKQMGGYGSSVEIDVAIALDHLMLAAVAEGLGTCWIGAFDEPTVKDLLGVPEDVRVVAITPLGYPEPADKICALDDAKRKSEADIFSTDRNGAGLQTASA